jgi:predicted membrane protein (TIGR00267 family)
MKFYLRNFVRGVIDGILSVLGVIIGSSVSNSSYVVIITGLSIGIAGFMANTASALTAERAEIDVYADHIAKSMLVKRKKIRKSRHFEKILGETYVRGITDGVGTIFGAIIPIIPFVFIIELSIALIVAIALSIILLAILGAFIGIISKTNVFRTSLKIATIGVVTSILCSLFINVIAPTG